MVNSLKRVKEFGFLDKKLVFDPYVLLVCLAFSRGTILRYVVQIIKSIPIIGFFADAFTPALFIVLLVLSLRAKTARINRIDVLFILSLFASVFLSSIISQDNWPYVSKFFPTVVFELLPFYFLGRTINMTQTLKKWLLITSEIAIFLSWAYYFYYCSVGRQFESDSMALSYWALLHLMIVLWCLFDCFSVIKLVYTISGALYILFLGTRGPVLIFLIYLVVLFGKHFFKKSRMVSVVIVLMILPFLIALINEQSITNIVLWLRDLANSWNLSTRVFDDYLYNIAQDSIDERSRIYSYLWELLQQKPLIGYGVYGEYPFINWSAHNMFLQVVFDFGFIIGVLLIVLFFVGALIALTSKNKDNASFILLFLCFIIPQGFFGGDIMSYYMFFIIGLITSQIIDKTNLLHVPFIIKSTTRS